MRLRNRILVAILIGIGSGALSYVLLAGRGYVASDFTYPWRAARALLEGADPYVVIQPAGRYPFEAYFWYPLPAALVAVPFAHLQPYVAGATFFALGSAALAFVVTARGREGLAVFTAAPFFVAASLAQWSPLIVAAALAPGFQWMIAVKPHLSLVSFAYRPSRLGFALAAALTLLSLLVMPRWPLEWLQTILHATVYKPPALYWPFGPFLLLAALRWRNREARHLFLLSLCPQIIGFYDQLPLWLVPQTWRKQLILSGYSWVAYWLWLTIATRNHTLHGLWLAITERTYSDVEQMYAAFRLEWPLVFLFIFYPALFMVLAPAVGARLARFWPHGPRQAT